MTAWENDCLREKITAQWRLSDQSQTTSCLYNDCFSNSWPPYPISLPKKPDHTEQLVRPEGERTENRAWPWLLLTHRFRVQSTQLWERNRAPSLGGQQTVYEGLGYRAIHPETASSCGVTAWAGWTALLSRHTKTSCHIAVMAVNAPTSSLTKEEPIRALMLTILTRVWRLWVLK